MIEDQKFDPAFFYYAKTYPLNTEIYVRIVKYCFHLLDLVEQGNELIKLGLLVRECKREKKCLLQPVLYILRLIGIDPDLTRLHLIETENIDHFKEIVRKEIGNSSKLNLYSSMKGDFKDKQYISDGKYYKYRLTVAKFRISGHAFPFEKGRWRSIPRAKEYVLYIWVI